ncbi:MAG: hypothetical protein M3380_19950, partial [Chloroflexota bacterium]|nr:hypothetical protein [Chloroflexota bacterium]
DYLGRLWQSCNALAFGDPQAGKPGQTMEMAQIFTMLRVQAEEMKEYAVIEALSRQRSCVLLGVPGGGKSTVVAFS